MVLSIRYKLLVRYKRKFKDLPYKKLTKALRFGANKSSTVSIKDIITDIYESEGNGTIALTNFKDELHKEKLCNILNKWELNGNRKDDEEDEFRVMNGKEYVKIAGPNYKNVSKTYEPDCIITRDDETNPGGYYGKITVLITFKTRYYRKCMLY